MTHHRDWAKDGDLFVENVRLRADIATVTAERDGARHMYNDRWAHLLAEQEAHAETRKALEALNADYGSLLSESNAHETALQSTRAELAKAKARVNTVRDILNLGTLDALDAALEALRG